jgi:hypothetical protein
LGRVETTPYAEQTKFQIGKVRTTALLPPILEETKGNQGAQHAKCAKSEQPWEERKQMFDANCRYP